MPARAYDQAVAVLAAGRAGTATRLAAAAEGLARVSDREEGEQSADSAVIATRLVLVAVRERGSGDVGEVVAADRMIGMVVEGEVWPNRRIAAWWTAIQEGRQDVTIPAERTIAAADTAHTAAAGRSSAEQGWQAVMAMPGDEARAADTAAAAAAVAMAQEEAKSLAVARTAHPKGSSPPLTEEGQEERVPGDCSPVPVEGWADVDTRYSAMAGSADAMGHSRSRWAEVGVVGYTRTTQTAYGVGLVHSTVTMTRWGSGPRDAWGSRKRPRPEQLGSGSSPARSHTPAAEAFGVRRMYPAGASSLCTGSWAFLTGSPSVAGGWRRRRMGRDTGQLAGQSGRVGEG